GQVLYVSDDGRYLIQAQPFDIQNKQFAASPGLLAYRRKQLDTVPKADRIVFAPANPKYTVTVFTDVECGYCRKLHSEIGELNKQGIAVEYLAFPRMGLGSQDHKEMIAVWCAADRKQALTAAKSGQPVASKDCKNPVSMEYT
ncbi:thioredoxin fold domain-containing protein, partial [Xanthomonas oryzae]|uniref:thioredoxin fold domain-containing protein n=5 Tax=Xanthomonas TaxID=338 RepID=UPI000E1938EA